MIELSILTALRDFSIAFIVAIGWGILFGTSKRLLVVAGLLGGMGHCIRFILLTLGVDIIIATLVGSVIIGLMGIFAAHKVHSPPVVFTMPACITMIPGLFAYRTMLSTLKLTDLKLVKDDPAILINAAHYLTLTASLLFTIAIGICIGALLFRKTSVREISLIDIILMRKNKKADY